uniref:Uncharacterized protein n=1 Tax=Wuchereria bancrofti TaxID=6293 RepID=A0A1I8EV96_WUCBA
MAMPTVSATMTELSTMDEQQLRETSSPSRETSSPSQTVVLRSTPGRTTWTKRLSKTIQRRSGSFLNTLVPFRKSIDQNHSNVNDDKSLLPLTLHQHKRRASASPAISLQTSSTRSALVNKQLSGIGIATATAGVVALISSGMHQEEVERQKRNVGDEIYNGEKRKQQQQQQQRKQQQKNKLFPPSD